MAEANSLILLPDGTGTRQGGQVRVLLLDADGLGQGESGTLDDPLAPEVP
jgi:hypothetical protein